jgi:HEPN domain-containing protein
MQPDPEQEARRWLEQALLDLDDARFNLEGGRFSLSCFVAQQAAEKALKAFLYRQGEETIRGHAVADLCDDAARFDREFERLKTEIAPLDKYYVSTRYPDALPGGLPWRAFNKTDARSALEMADRAIKAVEAKLR